MSERFTVIQGEVFKFSIQYQDPDGTPINLTGWTPKAQLVRKGVKIAELTVGSGLTFTPASGQIDGKVGSNLTDDFSFDVCDFEVWIFSPDGTEDECLVQERLTVERRNLQP